MRRDVLRAIDCGELNVYTCRIAVSAIFAGQRIAHGAIVFNQPEGFGQASNCFNVPNVHLFILRRHPEGSIVTRFREHIAELNSPCSYSFRMPLK